MRKLMWFAIPVALVFVLGSTGSLEGQSFDLSVRNIMRGPDLVGRSPTAFRGGWASWSPDSRYVYFNWEQAGVDTVETIYRVAIGDNTVERFPDADADTIVAGNGVWTRDMRRAAYAISGDLFLWDEGEIRRLTKTDQRETSPAWSPDGETLFFQSNNDVFAWHLANGAIEQMTDIRSGNAPAETEPEGQRKFLIEQQERLFEFVTSEDFDRQPWNRTSDSDSSKPKPFFIGEGKSLQDLLITPDGSSVLMTIRQPASNDRNIEMPVWITNDGYLDTYNGRSKVGDAQARTKAAILTVATGEVVFVGDSVGEGERNIEAVAVSPASTHVLVKVETTDNEHRWYVSVDLETGNETIVAHDHDEAWLTFPGPGLQYLAGFLPDGENVYFGSERTGWAHLYMVPVAGGQVRALTNGEWEVLWANLSPDGRYWYLGANREGFAEVHTYRMLANGGTLEQLTSGEGRQDATPSPDGVWLGMMHSEANLPWELYTQRNEAGEERRRVTTSTTEEWRSYSWSKPEIVMIPARDGALVPASLYRPQGELAPEGERPAVIFVHGAGYLQNVHGWWSGYFREYMFHHLLASRGYTVLALDYRGSAGHGRDWRTAIYRYMGGQDLTDNVDGARWLVDEMGIDSTKIGIYGGSYGGFITLMGMFTTPGVFASGAALRPVTDWAHYNHPYTSGILNEPQADSTAYVRSSPIYHAEGLEGHLLIAHGMVDDNVLFYDTARLAQRLIELGKSNWEVAIYPAERHGFVRASSWADEYRRIFELFERTLK